MERRPHKRCQIMHYSEENVRYRMFLPSSDPLITKPQKWNLHKVFCSNQGFLSYIVVVVFVDALVVVIENRKSGIQTEFSSLIRDLIRDELCIHRPDRRGAKLPSNLQIEFFSSCHPQSLTNPLSSNTPYPHIFAGVFNIDQCTSLKSSIRSK